MTDALALYEAIMGPTFRKAQRRSGKLRQEAAARQPRSYRYSGKARIESIAKTALGTRAAVFKRIRKGGCHNMNELRRQIDYVNDKADFVFSSDHISGDMLSSADKEDLVAFWGATMAGHTKNGYTSHMLLSFPQEASLLQVKSVALDWTEHFFESGEYGDRWDYVLAIHTDRDHPHAHIIVNNRGRDFGKFLSCWQNGVVSPQLMREKQAQFGENYGLHLDASTRLERGIFTLSPAIDEIYRAKAEGRAPQDRPMANDALTFAKGQAKRLSKEYLSVADILKRGDWVLLSRAATALGKALQDGQPHDPTPFRNIDMSELVTIREAVQRAENGIQSLFDHTETLDPIKRVEVESKAASLIADFSYFTPADDRSTAYRYKTATWPAELTSEELAVLKDAGEADRFLLIDKDAEALGLNPAVLKARIVAQSNNLGVLEDWQAQDTAQILDHAKSHDRDAYDLDQATALRDGLMDRYCVQAQVAALERTVGFDPDRNNAAQLIEDYPYRRVENIAAMPDRNAWDDQRFLEALHDCIPSFNHQSYRDRVEEEGIAAFHPWANPAPIIQRFLAIEAEAGQRYQRLDADLQGYFADRPATPELQSYDAATQRRKGIEAVTVADQLEATAPYSADERNLTARLQTVLVELVGEAGIASIRDGQTHLLRDAIPSVQDRTHVVSEYLEHSARIEKKPGLEKTASELRSALERPTDELEL